MFTPSKYQQAIYNYITDSTGSAVIEAVAGSGKTTTVLECLRLIPAEKSVLLLAFNKSIADELKRKAPAHVDVKTFNGLGHGIIGSRLGRVSLDTYKLRNILKNTMDKFDYAELGDIVYSLVGYARRFGIMPTGVKGISIMDDTIENWDYLIDRFSLPIERDIKGLIIDYARQAIINSIDICGDKKIVDFDDQIYIPAIKSLKGNSYDFIFVDEAQDVSPVRTALIKLVKKDNGRVIAVGDSKQAIYGFTGSDSEAMNTLRNTFNAVSLPLSISYRCAKSIIRKAQETMPAIESSDTAPEGEVNYLNELDCTKLSATDMIICRKNAPIISLAFKLISKGIPAKVMGRDIGTGLVKLIEKLKPKGIDGKHGLIEKLSEWQHKEIAKWQKDDNQAMIDSVTDKVACIYAIIERVNVSTVPALIREIEVLFSDDAKNNRAVTLSSVHKSKGLEADTVYFLDSELIPLKSARQAWQLEQEYNLMYVGVTRAKKVLNFITSENIK